MEFDIWMLLAGIGIFLFGIYLMEESLKAISGKAFKAIIRRYTSSRLKAIASGTLSTAILQSSSAVTLMVLAFVGAGIMSLSNAFGVILGSNLGTTLTSWIVATIGFKFSIETFALPFIGIGGLGLIFLGRSTRWSNISKLMVGFGFLFLGLDYMKVSVEEFAGIFDLSTFQQYHVIVFLLIGFAITAIMQSSSAAMAIILTAVYGNVIGFYAASAMVIGTNIGTTVTVLLGSIGGPVVKKQVALCHIVFNLLTGIIAFIFLKPLNFLVLDLLNMRNDPVLALALFHTIFNALGVLLFFPFTNYVTSVITKIIRDKKLHLSKFIFKVTSQVPEAAIVAIQNETAYMIRLSMVHNLKLLQLDPGLILSLKDSAKDSGFSMNHDKIYAMLKSVQSEVFLFSAKLQMQEMNEEEAGRSNKALHAIRYCVASAKTLKDVGHEFDHMDQSDHEYTKRKYQEFRKKMMQYYMMLDELLEGQNGHVKLQGIIDAVQNLHQEEQRTLKEIGEAINSGGILEGDISTLLSASRSFSLSLRQITLSVKDLVLTAEESAIYDKAI